MSSLLHQSQCKNQRQNTITGLLKKMSEKTGKPRTDQTPNDKDHETGMHRTRASCWKLKTSLVNVWLKFKMLILQMH